MKIEEGGIKRFNVAAEGLAGEQYPIKPKLLRQIAHQQASADNCAFIHR